MKTHNFPVDRDYFVNKEQELGKGGCGVVVVGQHKETQDLVAIKIVDKANAERGRLEREIMLLKDVDHCNIVRIFHIYDTSTTMYFVMEICTGGHLGSMLARKTPNKNIDENWARVLCRQLFSAVAYLHEQGIAHRDIKLQNVLLDIANEKRAQVKLIDFGYSSRFLENTPMRTKCGTPYTTAPEVLRECYDERCDVWSVGVVFFIMLSGKRPFEALFIAGPLSDAGKAAMTTNILANRYHFNHATWKSVSKDAISFVADLLHPNYMLRMRSSEALAHPWLVGNKVSLERALNDSTNMNSKKMVSNFIKALEPDAHTFKRTGLNAVAFGLPASQAAQMRSLFQAFDEDSSGMLDKSEFGMALRVLCPQLSDDDVSRIFDAVDVNMDGSISYTEFLAASLNPNEVFRIIQ